MVGSQKPPMTGLEAVQALKASILELQAWADVVSDKLARIKSSIDVALEVTNAEITNRSARVDGAPR